MLHKSKIEIGLHLTFMLAGNAIFTIQCEGGSHITYRVKKREAS
jgi:hypothetical protein